MGLIEAIVANLSFRITITIGRISALQVSGLSTRDSSVGGFHLLTMQAIESKDITLGDLFNDFYVVPNFQREYVWGPEEVEQLLEDINAEFISADRDVSSEYFIGTIVTCRGVNDDDVLQLIDGQQRMTTAYLVLCGIRDRITKLHAAPINALSPQISASSADAKGNDIFRYRMTLQYEDSCGILEEIAKGKQGRRAKSSTRSVRNIVSAYEVIEGFLESHFDTPAAVRGFYAYFTRNVKLIRVKTVSITHALKIFETINDRGVVLDSMDLLKNLIFMQAEMDEFDRLKERWKKIVDVLDQAREKPLRFLRYYIFARYGVERLREEEIYQWFSRNETICGYKDRPFEFVDDLLNGARAYAQFAGGKNSDSSHNRYLSNIRSMSGSARQHLVLLLAGRHLPDDLFTTLCREIENLFFAYVVTRENTREFERKFALWARALQEVSDGASLQRFLSEYFLPEKESLAARFELAFSELKEETLQKYRLRYVLAKLTQFVNEEGWGAGTQADLAQFLDATVHIEHVLPQNPSKRALDEFDKPDLAEQYISQLGNLVLAEEAINCSLGNLPFSEKQPVYTNSKFLLTRLLTDRPKVGKHTSVNKAIDNLPSFSKWSSETIQQRQAALTTLARKVWEMPKPRAESPDRESAPETTGMKR
jgi:hypothetical protein